MTDRSQVVFKSSSGEKTSVQTVFHKNKITGFLCYPLGKKVFLPKWLVEKIKRGERVAYNGIHYNGNGTVDLLPSKQFTVDASALKDIQKEATGRRERRERREHSRPRMV